jgi:hypothetical protein
MGGGPFLVYGSADMAGHRTGSARASRPGRPASTPPQQQRASGTIRRSDLRPRPPKPAKVAWPVVVAGVALGLLAVAWILAGRPSQQGVNVADASTSPAPSLHLPRTTGVAGLVSPAPPSATSTAAVRATATPPAPTRRPTPTASEPAPTESVPTESPPGQVAAFTIIFPADGELVRDQSFNVIGNGPPGATVTRDIPLWFDDHVVVREDGNWLMPITLGQGENVLRFRVGDDRATELVIRVIYQPRG